MVVSTITKDIHSSIFDLLEFWIISSLLKHCLAALNGHENSREEGDGSTLNNRLKSGHKLSPFLLGAASPLEIRNRGLSEELKYVPPGINR